MLRARPIACLRLLDHLSGQIVELDREVKQLARRDPVAKQLATIPASARSGRSSSRGDRTDRALSDRVMNSRPMRGLVPTTRSSGGKNHLRRARQGEQPWLKWILVEVVISLEAGPGSVSAYYRHLLRANGKPKATTAARAEVVLLHLLDVERGLELRGMAPAHENSRRSEVRPSQRLGSVA
jgi:transposase